MTKRGASARATGLGWCSMYLRPMPKFPSMKARELRRALGRPPLGYRGDTSKGGSHIWLEAEGRPRLRFAFHDRDTIPPGLVREILVKQVGLTEDEALDALH